MSLLTRHRPSPSRRAGAGEPVVLLHPLMLSHHSWRPVVDRLSQGHDVLALTLPGHWGGPPLPWHRASLDTLAAHVEGQMDAAGWATAHLVGNSLGGWLALELARRGRARSVTAIAPGGGHTTYARRDLLLGLAYAKARPARGLEEIDVPVHLVFAENDAVLPTRTHAPYFTDRIADAQVTHLAEHGHCPQLSDPDLVVALVKESVALSGRHLALAH